MELRLLNQYMLIRQIEGDDWWIMVGISESLQEAQLMAIQDAVKNGSNFGSLWTEYDHNPNKFWRGNWTVVTNDSNITYQIIRVK